MRPPLRHLLIGALAAPSAAFTFPRQISAHAATTSVHASAREDDYVEASREHWRLHRVDRLSTLWPGDDAKRINPLYDADHVHDSYFVKEGEAVLRSVIVDTSGPPPEVPIAFPRAGPRKRVFFEPSSVKAAIVTCGGICPGLNTVIRELVCCLEEQYGVTEVWGVPGGYRGIYDAGRAAAERARGAAGALAAAAPPLPPPAPGHAGWRRLTAEAVDQWHTLGGTALGTSRGGHDTGRIVDALEAGGVNMLFVIGGDGTLRGASLVAEEAAARGLLLSVVGVPKTVDNDIPIIDKSFGFETAVEEAQRAIRSASVEARAFPDGVGVVQLMGRNSGFIALHAALASREVDAVLVPEVDFELEGPGGLLAYMEACLAAKGHVTVVVAEGAGQRHLAAAHDGASLGAASGVGGGGVLPRQSAEAASLRRGRLDDAGRPAKVEDVGAWLCETAKAHLMAARGVAPSIKLINPTYMIRSVPANAADNAYCTDLAHSAVHGAFAGLTNCMVGPLNGHTAYVPLGLIFQRTNVVSVQDEVWARALFSTGQPDFDPSASIGECDVSTDTAYGGCTIDLDRLDQSTGVK